MQLERVVEYSKKLRRVALVGVVAASLFYPPDILASGRGSPHTNLLSCQQFLSAYTPSLQQTLVAAEGNLEDRKYIFFEKVPDPTAARLEITTVIHAVDAQAIVPITTKETLQTLRRDLPDTPPLTRTGESHQSFAKEETLVAQVKTTLDGLVTTCEEQVPSAQRKDGWYQQEKFLEDTKFLWECGIPIGLLFLAIAAADGIVGENK